MPEMTGRDLERILKKIGFRVIRVRGSHVIMKSDDGREVVVPIHERELGKGLLDRIVKEELGMEKDKFEKLVEEHRN